MILIIDYCFVFYSKRKFSTETRVCRSYAGKNDCSYRFCLFYVLWMYGKVSYLAFGNLFFKYLKKSCFYKTLKNHFVVNKKQDICILKQSYSFAVLFKI